jgi:hypothetical protein
MTDKIYVDVEEGENPVRNFTPLAGRIKQECACVLGLASWAVHDICVSREHLLNGMAPYH